MKRTALIRRVAMVRSGRLRRTAMKRTPSVQQQRQQALRRTAYQVVDARSGGQCEAVAWKLGRCPNAATVHHHRRLRGAGGSTDPVTEAASNILGLCAGCHDGFHAFPTASKALGLIVSAGHSPAAVPATLWCGSVLLSDDGEYRELPSPLRRGKTTGLPTDKDEQ